MTAPSKENTASTVLVTGASGYIAGWIIKALLDQGHTVHGTVRDPNKQQSVAHLHKMAEGTPGELKLFKADLLDAKAFDQAMQGCNIVMHTASPFIIDGFSDAYEALVRPAVEGTRNVLEAANRCTSVQRVVLTSSVASVFGDNTDLQKSGKQAFDENDWNTTSSVDHNPYQFSKVEAERAAWKIQKAQSQWDMVTINPGMVYGPSLTTASNSASIDTLVQMGDGRLRTGVPDLGYGVVDVRDVADAHLLAAFNSKAEGRYILVNRVVTMLGISKILMARFGKKYPFPRMKAPKLIIWAVGPLLGPVTRQFVSRNVGHRINFDHSRSEQLGVQYRPVEDTLTEHFQQALDDGLVKTR